MKTLVIKVGTSTLLGTDEMPSTTFDHVATSIKHLRETYDIVLVTSGAIGFGVRQTGISERPHDLHELQALSMIGQVGLLRRWREAFGDLTVGQVLVTRQDLERNITAGIFRQSVAALWKYGAIPIVNENDAVSSEEISFGDNDRLAAEVAVAIDASRLVMLTDQDGVQAAFGTADQKRLEVVHINEIGNHIQIVRSHHGKGGAASKVQAARIALGAGIQVNIAHASTANAIEDALSGKVGTRVVQ